jgi:4-hydroxy-2-oxoheptanedioate aldolase
MANTIRQLLQAGKGCANGWLSIPSGFAAELMALAGYDSLTVDLQHGVQDYQTMIQCFQAIGGYDVTPLVRVPWNEPGIIGKVLDGGAAGVIAPMINTREQAAALVAACKYPPRGSRSNGPIRAGLRHPPGGYQRIANDDVLVIPMIETAEALDNLEAILDVPGIDMIYVGPSDLGFSLGLPPLMDREEPQILDIYARLIRETSKRGIHAGIHNNSPKYAARMLEMGFRFVTLNTDAGLLAQAARQVVGGLRGGDTPTAATY